jgi:hypothetical protein
MAYFLQENPTQRHESEYTFINPVLSKQQRQDTPAETSGRSDRAPATPIMPGIILARLQHRVTSAQQTRPGLAPHPRDNPRSKKRIAR